MQSANKMCVALLFGGMSSEHEVSSCLCGQLRPQHRPQQIRGAHRGHHQGGPLALHRGHGGPDGRWQLGRAAGNMACVISPDRADHGMILFTPDGQVEKMHLWTW